MKKTIVLFITTALLASCEASKEDLITRRWQAVALESPMIEGQMQQLKEFIDTVGTTTDAVTNEALYGVANMDSMRQQMRLQFDTILNDHKEAVHNTWLDFREDGSVVASFGAEPDTVAWYFEEDGTLMLDEMKLKGTGSKNRMKVNKLDKDSLRLEFKENEITSTAVFIPTGK